MLGEQVDYTVTLNSKDILSVVYHTEDKDGRTILKPVNLEMKRAGELKTDTAFSDLKAVSALTGIDVDKLKEYQFYFEKDSVVFIHPVAKDGTEGYSMVRGPLMKMRPYLKL